MLGSIFIGLSGMTAYSRGLDTISNNVANLNTPGFKLSVPIFTDIRLNAGRGDDGRGGGVEFDAARLSFRQPEARDSSNPQDAALDGSGFFVLDQNGERVFTRAGQFVFDEEGFLIERTTGARVVVNTEEQQATHFNVEAFRTLPFKQTTEVFLQGQVVRTSTTSQTLEGISVIDSSGTNNVLRAVLMRDANDPLRWRVDVQNQANEVIGSNEIRFNEDGTPQEGFNTLSFTLQPENLPAVPVTLRFGEPGSISGVTSPPAQTFTNLSVQKQDGFPQGALNLQQSVFDAKGRLTLVYSNGQTRTPATLLLALFNGTDGLRAQSGGFFTADANVRPVYGVAQESGLGTVLGRKIEPSNVELTEQFTDLIIIQRGYQASSQMTSVANEMLQQLLAIGRQQ